MLTVIEAKEEILKCVKSFGTEVVAIQEALGRILAEDIAADRDYPPFNRAAMDGFALKMETDDQDIRNKEYRVIETIFAGDIPQKSLHPGECYKIMTGASVPLPANIVIRVEDVVQNKNMVTFLTDQVKLFKNIACKGEDVAKGDMILKAGQLCSTAVISALAATGKHVVKVQRLPTLGIVSTGNEIKAIDFPVSSVQIRDSNSYAIEAFFRQYGIHVTYRQLVPDDETLIKRSLSLSIANDITVISGGVSAGDADFIPAVLSTLGVKKIFHKVRIKPGKPLWFGVTDKGNVVFALPGNPMSVQVALKVFIEPFIRECMGAESQPVLLLPMLADRIKKVKFDEFFPAIIKNEVQSGLSPVKFNGSGDITSTLNCHGLVFHPAEKETFNMGDIATFFPW